MITIFFLKNHYFSFDSKKINLYICQPFINGKADVAQLARAADL